MMKETVQTSHRSNTFEHINRSVFIKLEIATALFQIKEITRNLLV